MKSYNLATNLDMKLRFWSLRLYSQWYAISVKKCCTREPHSLIYNTALLKRVKYTGEIVCKYELVKMSLTSRKNLLLQAGR